jgi:SAM-dependent methyltransferase
MRAACRSAAPRVGRQDDGDHGLRIGLPREDVARLNGANAAQAERWNGESGRYWVAHRERHLAEHRYLVPRLFGAARLASGERVLDVGCGCGATTIEAARLTGGVPGSSGCAVGLDLSRPMLAVARRLAAEHAVANVGFVQCDAQTSPLRRDSYDAAISSFGVMFFADPAAAFARLAAALRRGGRLAFLCWQPDMSNDVFGIPLDAFRAYTPLPSPTETELFTDPRWVRNLLSGSGWRDIQIDAVNEPALMGTDVADVMSYVRGMPMIRRLTTGLKEAALTERALDDMARTYAARERPDGVWVNAAAWLVTARAA